ncbi:divergent polysaccharide deacetylase family protein [candidate division KSB1 bacterium]|nr:divergent polysaccharide deacetylase family protein [candidate division KSB1 bacterium]
MLRRSFYQKPTRKRYLVIQKWNKRLTISAIFFAVLRFVVIPYLFPDEKNARSEIVIEEVDSAVRAVCVGLNIPNEKISQQSQGLEIIVPSKVTVYRFVKLLEYQLSGTGSEILAFVQESGDRFVAFIGNRRVKLQYTFKIISEKVAKARIAVIIDDFGYSYNNTVTDFLSFQKPITISIIPGLKQSKKIAQIAKLGQKDFLIHMPMEPLNESYSDDGFILLSLHDPATLRKRMRKAMSELPHAVGMNNHQGSRATSDPHLMDTVLGELQSRNLLFIDSRTTSASVAYRIAVQKGIPAAQNNIFLDQEDSRDYIRGQVEKLADLAHQNTKALAIGHVRENTLVVLQESIEYLELRGIEFVSISQYINLP